MLNGNLFAGASTDFSVFSTVAFSLDSSEALEEESLPVKASEMD